MTDITITLDALDWGQVLDGLHIRAETWECTARYLLTGEVSETCIVEECSEAHEAEHIAVHYRSIISNINHQIKGASL